MDAPLVPPIPEVAKTISSPNTSSLPNNRFFQSAAFKTFVVLLPVIIGVFVVRNSIITTQLNQLQIKKLEKDLGL